MQLQLVMSLLAMSLGLDSRMGRTGGGGQVSTLGWDSKAASGLSYRKPLVGTGWAISLFRMNGLKTICPSEAPISGIEALFNQGTLETWPYNNIAIYAVRAIIYYVAPISTGSAGSNVGLVKFMSNSDGQHQSFAPNCFLCLIFTNR